MKTAGKLNPKQARFVAEYLVDLNATAAAARAGYSQKTSSEIGRQLLGKPWVRAAIERAQADRSQRTEITQDTVLAELARLAFSDITNYVIDDLGNVQLAEGAHKRAMRAVSSIKRKVFTDAEGNVTREVELRLWDKPSMLKLAGMHVGLFRGSKDGDGVMPDINVFVGLATASEGKPPVMEAVPSDIDRERLQ